MVRNRIGFPTISTTVFPDHANPSIIKKYVSEIPEIYMQTLSSTNPRLYYFIYSYWNN